jgi:3-methyladenine DNA glycosylase AlkD
MQTTTRLLAMPYRAWVNATKEAFSGLGNPTTAEGARNYMKNVAPFLGISTVPRRAALKAAWKPLPPLDEANLAKFCSEMWKLPEREYQYAACDLLAWNKQPRSAGFLMAPLKHLVINKSWWDTIDALNSNAINPLVREHPELLATMWEWIDDENIWLVRVAIQHQRGLRDNTDLDLLFAMCQRHITDKNFWIAKAIGWALRDASAYWPQDVQAFIDRNPGISSVARREGQRGVIRALAK